MTNSIIDNPDISMTDAAARQLKRIAQDHPERAMMRIRVQGGGCSGFSYEFSFAQQRGEQDLLIEHDGANLLIDIISLPFLSGSELDYCQELIGSAFRVNNPNAVAACGCGTSFSI